MSKTLLDDVQKLQWRTPDELRDSFGVDFHPSTVSSLLTQQNLCV